MKNDNIKKLFICGGIATMLGLASCGGASESTSEVYYGDGPGATNGADNSVIDEKMLESDSLAPDAEAVVPDTAKSIDANEATKAYTHVEFATPEEAVEYMKNSAHWEEYSQGILPQMKKESLSYAQKLLNSRYNHFIIVDKDRMKVVLCDKYGRVEKEYTMACAKNYGSKSGDWDSRTPEGFFSAEGVYNSTDWLFRDKNGRVRQTRGQYGPRFIRLKTPVTSGVGIHGTCSPGALGKRVSHGCIRIKNENILELVEYVEKGMPIIVSPGTRDMKVNDKEGRNVVKISSKKIVVDTLSTIDKVVSIDSIAKDTKKSSTKSVDTIAKETPVKEKATEVVNGTVPVEEKPSQSKTKIEVADTVKTL